MRKSLLCFSVIEKKRSFFICMVYTLLLLFSIDLKSQTDYCVIIDSLSKKPVGYASISAGLLIIYADELGAFSTKDLPNDTIRISRLGYHSIAMLKSELTPTMVLVPKDYSIKEFVVSGKAESFEIGYHNRKSVAFSWAKDYKAVLILSPKPGFKIEKVLVHTRNNRKGTMFIVSLFSVRDNGLPGDIIFTKEYSSPTGKNLLEIPVDEANLEMPENGVFVAIKKKEAEDDSNYSVDAGIVRLTKVHAKNLSFVHYQNRWLVTDSGLDYQFAYMIGLELRSY
jgi:hypothetical protein